jgi:hypothetical protein
MARRRRIAPKVVVSSGKFVRAVILPLRGKDLVETRKAIERDPTCCGRIPLQAPQRRRSCSFAGGELRKQILVSPLWFASLVLISSTFTLLPLNLLGRACL